MRLKVLLLVSLAGCSLITPNTTDVVREASDTAALEAKLDVLTQEVAELKARGASQNVTGSVTFITDTIVYSETVTEVADPMVLYLLDATGTPKYPVISYSGTSLALIETAEGYITKIDLATGTIASAMQNRYAGSLTTSALQQYYSDYSCNTPITGYVAEGIPFTHQKYMFYDIGSDELLLIEKDEPVYNSPSNSYIDGFIGSVPHCAVVSQNVEVWVNPTVKSPALFEVAAPATVGYKN